MARDVSRISRIAAIAEPIAAERGLEVLEVELAGSAANPLVRVLLDSPDESRRVGIEDCQAVSQRLGDGLDAHEVVSGRYMLEVSSAGVNKPLRRIEHFRRVAGRKVRVRTRAGAGERHTWLGRLEHVDDEGIAVVVEAGAGTEAETVRIAWDDIDKANLEFEFPSPGQPGKPGQSGRKRRR